MSDPAKFLDARPLLQDLLQGSVARLPDKVALVCGGERRTWSDLGRATHALAHALVRCGVGRGDRVLVLTDNGASTVIGFWAALEASAVPSVISPQTRGGKLAYLIGDCAPAALVVDARLLSVVLAAREAGAALPPMIVARAPAGATLPDGATRWEEAVAAEPSDAPPPRRSLDIDLAAIIYTSGSTGDAKGVMLTHRNMLTAAASVSSYLGYAEADVIVSALPLSFDYGLYQMLMAARVGARLVLERSFAFPTKVLERMQAERATVFPGVPTMYALLAGLRSPERWDLSTVRNVTNTAAALAGKHIEVVRGVFPQARIFSMYGLTECKRVSYLPPEELDRKPDSVGVPIPNTEVWIVDDRGRRVPPGVVGQLVVRGATVMRGYWGKPEATAKKLRPGPLPGEQVLYTGDYCRLDEDGYLYFVARMDDIIKSQGEKVSPKEVENALLDVPGVVEAAVIGVPDPILGQAVKAFVVLAPDADLSPEQIRRESRGRLEAIMVPKEVVVVADLPKTTSGKIKKTDLR